MSVLIKHNLAESLNLVRERLRPMETSEPQEVAYDAIIEAMHWYIIATERCTGENRPEEAEAYSEFFAKLTELSIAAKKDHEKRQAHK